MNIQQRIRWLRDSCSIVLQSKRTKRRTYLTTITYWFHYEERRSMFSGQVLDGLRELGEVNIDMATRVIKVENVKPTRRSK